MFWVAGRLQQHRGQSSMLSVLSINREIGYISWKKMEAGEIDSSVGQQILRLGVSRRKKVGT